MQRDEHCFMTLGDKIEEHARKNKETEKGPVPMPIEEGLEQPFEAEHKLTEETRERR